MLRALLFAALALAAGPRIVSSEPWQPPCPKDDPIGCYGEKIVVENLARKAADVTVKCGGAEYDEQHIQVPARTRMEILIELSLPPPRRPACHIVAPQR